MEAQNHFYGHSAAFAAHVGRPRPRHVNGLVQHGWTAVSPVSTHFRDFPDIGTAGGPAARRLLVWSHRSRAWDPRAETHVTTPIGAQLVYLARVAGPTLAPRDPRDEVVLMPVHGIQTQRVRGDHRALADGWRDAEGPATACLYAADAADPQILGAYREAGHRVVVLGERLDPDFLWRLWTLLGRARRVVSNRLSTPVLYAGHLGADIGVYGDPLRVDGELTEQNDRVRELWPELHGEQIERDVAKGVIDAELGVKHVLDAADLEAALGWDGTPAVAALQYWTTSVARRAVVNVRRKRNDPPVPPDLRRGSAATDDDSAPNRPGPPIPAVPAGHEDGELSFLTWLRAATSYLPRPLPRAITPAGVPREPIEIV